MNKLTTLALLLTATACLGDDPTGRIPAALLESCGAEYACEFPDGSIVVMQSELGSRYCEFDAFSLESEGRVNNHGPVDALDYWVGDADRFTVCNDADTECVACDRTGPLPAGEPAERETGGGAEGGYCDGYAENCLNLSTTSCSGVDGCYTSSRFLWNGDLERYCTGTSENCSEYSRESPCDRQSGCAWIPT